MTREETVGTVIYSVTPRGSMKTSKPSVVEMAVPHRFANRADELCQDIKANEPPETGLVALHLVAVYEDGRDDEVIELKPDLDEDNREMGQTDEGEK